MMDSVRGFAKNFIKYFLYIAVFAQIVSGTVYLVCNFSEFVVYPETEEMVHAARTMVFDEYIGFLYPLFVRVCLSIQNMCGMGYYLFVHGVQLVAMFLAAYYMVKPLFPGKKAWLLTAYVMTIPMCMQTALMVSPFAFKAVFAFLIAGSMVRIWKCNGKIWVWLLMLGTWAASAFNLPDDLFVWGLPIFVLSLIVLFRRKDKMHIAKRCCIVLAVVLVFLGAFGTVQGVTEAGSRGRMHKTVNSVLFQRTAWPGLGEKYGFLPLDMQYYLARDEMAVSDSHSEMIANSIGPRIEQCNGTERAEELFGEAARTQFSYNLRATFNNVSRDFMGYFLTPYSMVGYMQGEDGSALGTLYGRMSLAAPKLIHVYFSIFYIALFGSTFVAILNVLKGKKNVKLVILVIAVLLYQAAWYAIVNVQGVDYRYALVNAVIYVLTAWGCCAWEHTKKTDEEKRHFPYKKIFSGVGIALGVAIVVIALGNFRTSYRESDVLQDKKAVCFGDSIWGLVDDETGIEAYLEDMTGVTVENYAIPGTSASDFYSVSEKNVTEWSLYQIVAGLQGEYAASKQEFEKIDASLTEADYIILAYGLNDYFQGTPAEIDGNADGSTYEGALCHAVEYFQKNYPEVQIVLIGQTYCQFYSYGVVEDDSDTCSFGGGVGTDYVEVVRRIAQEYDLMFIDMYREIPMNEWNGILYLEDATHLNQKGRLEYAKIVAETLVNDYKERNAQ